MGKLFNSVRRSGTKFVADCKNLTLEWSVSSAGEHYVDIVGVTGSIPVRSTIAGKWRDTTFLAVSCLGCKSLAYFLLQSDEHNLFKYRILNKRNSFSVPVRVLV